VQAAAAGLQQPSGKGLQSEASGVMGTSFYISPEIEQVQYGITVQPQPNS
jgi:hypothetical protein